MPPGTVGKLVRCCYGTRDAGMLWEEAYAKVLVDAGFIRGRASPCCFFHPVHGLAVVCHGDDFTALGSDEALTWYENILANAFEIGDKHRMGDDPKDDKQVRILNRVLTLTSSELVYEADPRHLERLARPLGLTYCGKSSSPGSNGTFD